MKINKKDSLILKTFRISKRCMIITSHSDNEYLGFYNTHCGTSVVKLISNVLVLDPTKDKHGNYIDTIILNRTISKQEFNSQSFV